jgi:hypothetical protein
MDTVEGAIWFMGDLSDPWVVSIADALSESRSVVRLDCAGELPDRPFDPSHPPRLIVMHRHRLTPGDAEQLRRWREPAASAAPPALFLCVSPYVRYEDLERWSGLVNLVLSEASAPDVLLRHVARLVDEPASRPARGASPSFRIEVAGTNDELRKALAEACARAGYRVEQVDDGAVGDNQAPVRPPVAPGQRVLTIWDVPVLEPGWPERLERRSRATGPVIVLFGFADRTTVACAKAHGAAACLELPYNVDDLLDVIDRTARRVPQGSWGTPAKHDAPHILPPRPRGRRTLRQTPAAVPAWLKRTLPPTMD